MPGIFLRDRLRAPDDGGSDGGGGAEPKPLTFTQAELDSLIQKRVGPITEKLRSAEKMLEEFEPMKARLLEREQEIAAAREEEAMKGKTELEKAKMQLEKNSKLMKEQESEWAKKLEAATAEAAKQAEARLSYVKQTHVSQALHAAGVRAGASKHALQAFLAEAELELSDANEISRVTVGGKPFDKPTEAAAHFLTQYPHFAEAKGGSGTPPPNGFSGGRPTDAAQSVVSLLGQGHAGGPG